MLRILFIGDIVGKPGRKIVKSVLKEVIKSESIDLVIANAENSAGGFGVTLEVCDELMNSGINVMTLGNHTWDNREAERVLDEIEPIVRPANYPEGTPGSGIYLAETAKGILVGVLNLLGVVYLDSLSCPFRTADAYIQQIKKRTDIIIVDMHAEATSEKIALGWYLDGRVTAVIGTHTHVTTADEHILPKGTGYITDVGMTGPSNSVLGIKPEIILQKFLTKRPVRFELAPGPVELNAVVIETNEYGLASSIKRVRRTINEG